MYVRGSSALLGDCKMTVSLLMASLAGLTSVGVFVFQIFRPAAVARQLVRSVLREQLHHVSARWRQSVIEAQRNSHLNDGSTVNGAS